MLQYVAHDLVTETNSINNHKTISSGRYKLSLQLTKQVVYDTRNVQKMLHIKVLQQIHNLTFCPILREKKYLYIYIYIISNYSKYHI